MLAAKLDKPPPETMAILRSMLTSPAAAEAVRAFLNERVANLAKADARPDAELAAALTVSSLLGLTLTRHFLHLDAFEHATSQEIERAAIRWLNLAPGTSRAAPGTGPRI